jgi:S-DNA-T family DNA segregation ATPase FtsK/SpoIIIE
MKSWFKRYFGSKETDETNDNNRFGSNELYEETPIQREYQENIEKPKPKFRFPIDLDDDIDQTNKNHPTVEIKDQYVEPQNKYVEPQNQWKKSTIQSNFDQQNNKPYFRQSSQITRNQINEVEEVKEEKVEVIFKPKRKTPFKPSEYISPIYGYNRPPVKKENSVEGQAHSHQETNVEESKRSETPSNLLHNYFDEPLKNIVDEKNHNLQYDFETNESVEIEKHDYKESPVAEEIDKVEVEVEVEVIDQVETEVIDEIQTGTNDFINEIKVDNEQEVSEEIENTETHFEQKIEDSAPATLINVGIEETIEPSNLNESKNEDENEEQIQKQETEAEIVSEKQSNDPILKPLREKKRHVPFNVMMLRSDFAAVRRTEQNKSKEVPNSTRDEAQNIEETSPIRTEAQIVEGNITQSGSTESPLQTEREINPIQEVRVDEVFQKDNVTSVVQSVEEINDIQEVPVNEVVQREDTVTSVIQPVEDNQEPKEETLSIEDPEISEENEDVILERSSIPYELPSIDLLTQPPYEEESDGDWIEDQKMLLQETLHNFNVGANVIAATQGPTVTRFEVQPEPGVKVNKITNLQDDIKLSLAARDIRIEAPIPGRSAIGIEVPNRESKPVYLSELVNNEKFIENDSPLTVALGLDIGGEPIYADISKMPHGLIAGATGSGKSVCINSILVSILYKAQPHEVKLILIDPKMVELAPYNHIPHLISPVITDARAATAALKWACDEMERRYDLFAHAGARDIKRFNSLARSQGAYADELPYLVIVIDELADLMMVSPGDVETYICRIAQKARACGIHLLVATQRPSVDVVTGIIKSNIPTRIAFTVSSQVDSRTIIDIGGAEKLLGRGDMLFLDNGKSQPIRLQGVFVSDEEIENVVELVKDQQKPNYLFNQEELVAKADAQDVDDDLFDEAVQFVIEQDGASVSMLQRRFRIGYNRAARLVDLMYDHGIVSGQNGSKPRDVLISLEDFLTMN